MRWKFDNTTKSFEYVNNKVKYLESKIVLDRKNVIEIRMNSKKKQTICQTMLDIVMILCYDCCMKMIRFKFIQRLYRVSFANPQKPALIGLPESDGLALSLAKCKHTCIVRQRIKSMKEMNISKYFNCV